MDRGLISSAALAAMAALLGGCAAQPPPAPVAGLAANEAGSSILVSSSPAPGSTVHAPVNNLALHFAPPARLDQVTVTGPDGTMPMMVNAVGEVADYSLPLPGLGPGNYTVQWKALVAGTAHQGSFAFTAK